MVGVAPRVLDSSVRQLVCTSTPVAQRPVTRPTMLCDARVPRVMVGTTVLGRSVARRGRVCVLKKQ